MRSLGQERCGNALHARHVERGELGVGVLGGLGGGGRQVVSIWFRRWKEVVRDGPLTAYFGCERLLDRVH